MQEELIAGLKKSFERGFIDDVFEVGGHTWGMQTLNGLESQWRDRYVEFTASAAFLSSRKVPTLAAAIKLIDGQSVLDIFGEKKTSPDDKTSAIMNMVNRREQDFDTPQFQAAEKLRVFLENSIPSQVVDKLYERYNELEMKSEKILTGVLGDEEKKEDTPKTNGGEVPDGTPFQKGKTP
jgi:hypothetical protein